MRIKDFIQDMQIQAKRVDQRFDKIPRYYYWIFGGIFPAFIVMSIPSLSGLFFTIHATGLTWFFVFSFVTAVTTLLFGCSSILILLFGILFILVIKDNKGKIIGIKKAIVDILLSKDKNDSDAIKTKSELKNVITDAMDEIMKKDGNNLNRKAKEALLESNRAYQGLRKEIDELKKMVGSQDIAIILHCSKCGNETQVDPPEKDYFPSKNSCNICYWNNELQPITYECKICENHDTRHWHNPKNHSLIRRISAYIHRIRKKTIV